MGWQRCLLTCKGTARNSLICYVYWHPLSLLNGDTCVSKFLTPFFGMSCYVMSIIIVKVAFTHFIPFICFFVLVWNFIYCSLSYISSPPRGNHHAKSVTYSFFEASSYKFPSTLHIKAVVGPEYIVIEISSATLRKLIYKDCVTNIIIPLLCHFTI